MEIGIGRRISLGGLGLWNELNCMLILLSFGFFFSGEFFYVVD